MITSGLGLPLPVPIAAGNSASVDGAGRWRTSEPTTVFDSKLLVDKQPLHWSEFIGLGGSSVYNTNQSSVTITASTEALVYRQTFRRMPYQPGKSQLFHLTFIMGPPVAGQYQEVGAYSSTNGFFLRQAGAYKALVRRTYTSGSVVDNEVKQEDWNLDKLDGTGKSGITLNLQKCTFFTFDFLWQGVGAIRFGFKFNGAIIYCHEMIIANTLDVPHIQIPNLPIRYAVRPILGAVSSAWLTQICATCISEGGFNPIGTIRSVNNGTTVKAIGAGAKNALISIRLKSTHLMADISEKTISVLAKTASNFLWELWFNPTVTGASFVSTLTDESAIEYDVSGTTISGGYLISSGYGSQGANQIQSDIENSLKLGSSISGAQTILTLAVTNLGNASEDYLGSLTWKEII